MTKTKVFQQTFQDIPLSVPNKSDEQTWSLLIRAVNDHHKVHRIGRPDTSNTLAQVLLTLYNLGDFFDREIDTNGLNNVFQTYFPSLLDGCLGSHVLAITHVAFGMENSLSNMVSEGLAQICTTFLDVGDLLITQPKMNLGCDEVLDMIRCDQRFHGRLSAAFVAGLKALLCSRRDLLKLYMECMHPAHHNNLDAKSEAKELVILASRLIQVPTLRRPSLDTPPASPPLNGVTKCAQSSNCHLGGALLSSALAIERILPHLKAPDDIAKLLNLQRLSTICTFIIQGKPALQYTYQIPQKTWEDCRQSILESDDTRTAIIFNDLDAAQKLSSDDTSHYLCIANMLSDAANYSIGWRKNLFQL
ncbi:hypothetical protein NQZ79_g1525 [Umbelopsis isabellina]|nr:hypothetical protein NQZ79_g1525 [Umbelopsis isabellina]